MMQTMANPQAQAAQGIAALPLQSPATAQGPQAAAPQPQQMQQTPEQILALLKQANDAKAAELAQREMALNRPAQPTVMAQLQQKAQQGQAMMQQPPAQAPGIDNLPSNIQMAGGGIVGFYGGGGVDEEEPQYRSVEDNLNTRHPQNETSALNKLRAMLAAGMDITKVFRDVKTRPTGLMPYSEGESRRRATENMDPRDFAAKRSAPMRQASYSNEGRNSTAPKPEQEAIPGSATPPAAVKAAAGKVAASGGGKGLAALLQDKARATAPEAAEDDWSAYTKARIKALDVDPTKQRNDDAQYVKDNSGLADEKVRRDKAREGMTAGQEAVKAARPTGIRELLLNMAEQGKANRGFRNESPIATLMGDRAAAGVAMNKNQQNNAKTDYDMLVALNKQGDADAAVQLSGNAAATEAGLKGADRARAQQTAGTQAATSYAGVLENTQQRREAVEARSQDMKMRYAEMRNAKASGDKAAATMAKEQLVQGMKALTADLQGMMRMDPLMNPGLSEDIKAARALLNSYSQALLGTVPALKDVGPNGVPNAAGNLQSAAQAELARRAAQGK